MSTQGLRQFIERDARRNIVPDFDLNIPPPAPTENMAPDCITFHASSQGFPAELHRGSQLQLRNSVEVIDDDIAIIDRSTFTEAKNNSRRNHSQFTDGLRDVLNEAGVLINSLSDLTELSELTELTELTELAELASWCSKPRRTASDEAEDLCMIVGASKSKSSVKNVLEPPEFPQNPIAVAPVFNCPICIGPLKDATTTRCGHIRNASKRQLQPKANALLVGRNWESVASSGFIFHPLIESILCNIVALLYREMVFE